MIGRYPDYDVLANRRELGRRDAAGGRGATAAAGPLRFFSAEEEPTLRAFCDVTTAQDTEPRVPVAEMVDDKLAAGRLDGFRYANMPRDPDTWRLVLRGLDETARARHGVESFAACDAAAREAIVTALSQGELSGGAWDELDVTPGVVGVHARDPGRVLLPPVGVERDRLRRAGLPAGLHAPRARSARSSPTSDRAPPPRIPVARRVGAAAVIRGLLKGSIGPEANDSRFLLDVHRRDLPGQDTMARYRGLRRGRPGDRRRRRRRLGARPAPGPPRVADRDHRGGPVLASRRGLGLRRGGLAPPLLDAGASDRRRGPDRDGQEQLGPRRRRLDGPLRRLLPALSPLGL